MSKVFYNKSSKADSSIFKSWSFSNINYILFSIGIALIIIGYILMASGEVNSLKSLTIAPIILFLGYIVFIPLALIYKDKTP
tara:strand:- start:56 stop:301 length:246 start_codon:yes stop_codon:yes gene_type:complete